MVEPPPLPDRALAGFSAPPPPIEPPAAHRGILIFIFGLLGLFGLLPLGAAAWAMANRDLDRMGAGLTDRSGEGMTRAGKMLGAIGLIGACVTLGGIFLLLLLAASALSGT